MNLSKVFFDTSFAFQRVRWEYHGSLSLGHVSIHVDRGTASVFRLTGFGSGKDGWKRESKSKKLCLSTKTEPVALLFGGI